MDFLRLFVELMFNDNVLNTFLSIISLITTCIGLYLLGKKDKYGFFVFSISLTCQLIIFSFNKNWFLVLQMIVLIVFNLVNFNKWKKEELHNK